MLHELLILELIGFNLYLYPNEKSKNLYLIIIRKYYHKPLFLKKQQKYNKYNQFIYFSLF